MGSPNMMEGWFRGQVNDVGRGAGWMCDQEGAVLCGRRFGVRSRHYCGGDQDG